MQRFNQRLSAGYDTSGPRFFQLLPWSASDQSLYFTVGNHTYCSYAADWLKSRNYRQGFFQGCKWVTFRRTSAWQRWQMGTNGNGEEIGWNKSESVLAPGSQPPSQTSYESVCMCVCRGHIVVRCWDSDIEGKRKVGGWHHNHSGFFPLLPDDYDSIENITSVGLTGFVFMLGNVLALFSPRQISLLCQMCFMIRSKLVVV